MEDVSTNEPHLTGNRTPLKSKLSSIVEKKTVFNPKTDKVGRIDASGSNRLFLMLNISQQRVVIVGVSGGFCFLILSSSATVFLLFNRLLEKGLKHLLLCFPHPPRV